MLLAVEVADSSLDYDLRRKPLVYAAFGVREIWVIDAARRIVHRHEGPEVRGYATVQQCGSRDLLVPRHAPAAFASALEGLDEL